MYKQRPTTVALFLGPCSAFNHFPLFRNTQPMESMSLGTKATVKFLFLVSV